MDTTANRPVPSYTAPHKNDLVWNILTFAVLLSTICLVGIFSLIYLFPNSSINPFPPSSESSAAIVPPVATTEISLPPTEPPVETTEVDQTLNQPALEPTEEPSLEPTSTSLPTFVVTPIPPADTATPLAEIAPYPFDLRNDPAYIASTIIHPDENCQWMGIAGQVFDRQGAPLLGVSVLLAGSLNEKSVSILSLTGTARQYGEAGYEFYLGDQPLNSKADLWIQLLDQAQLAISPKIPLTTYSDCQKNLTLVNFRQVR